MKLSAIIRKIRGINPDFIYYLENKGYIKPKKIEKEKVLRREYSEKDFLKIQKIWKYYEEGFPPKIAQKKALEEIERENRIAEADSDDLISKLGELRDLIKSNPSLEISTQGIMELKDTALIESLIDSVRQILNKGKHKSLFKKTDPKMLTRFIDIMESKKTSFTLDSSLEKILDKMGITIEEVDYPTELFGVSGKAGEGRYLILINKKHNKIRSYILTHELMHILSADMSRYKDILLRLIEKNISFLKARN